MKKLANINDVPNKGSKLVFLDETPIALFKINGKIHAWDNRCPHRGASLSDGYISDTTIQCKYHLWEKINNPKMHQCACDYSTSKKETLCFNLSASKK